MAELESQAKALLERAKPAFSPRPEDLARLQERLGLSDPPGGGGGGSPPPAAGLKTSWKLAASLVVGAVLAGGAIGTSVLRSDPSPRALGKGQVMATKPDAVQRSMPTWHPRPWTLEQPAADGIPDPLANKVAPPTPRRAQPTPQVQNDRQPRERPAEAQVAAPASSLSEELELITAARRALRARHFTQTQDLATRYREEFPAGAFGEEAEVLSLVAECGLALGPQSQGAARAYLERSSGRFSQLVRHACSVPPAARPSGE